MTMMHWEPFRAFRDMERLSSELLSGTRVPLSMPMDVWREGQTYHVALDLPGVDPESIEVELERNTLTVSGQRQAEYGSQTGRAGSAAEAGRSSQAGTEGPQVLVAERPQGSFTRQLALGDGLDRSGVQADYRNGVLYLTIPVAQQAQPRRIQVGQRGETGGQPQVIEGTSQNAATDESGE